MTTKVNLLAPGTLISLNIDFWVDCPRRNYKIVCENPLPKWADISDDRILLMAILGATRNGIGLVLEDKILQARTKNWSSPEDLFLQSADGQKLLTVRKIDILFGEHHIQILMNGVMTEKNGLSFFDEAFIVKL